MRKKAKHGTAPVTVQAEVSDTADGSPRPVKAVILRDNQGRYLPGVCGNPKGRPKGAKTKRPEPFAQATLVAQTKLETEAGNLVAQLVDEAKAGDKAALRMLVERTVPVSKERAVPIKLPPIRSPEDAILAHEMLGEAMARGLVTPTEVNRLTRFIEAGLRAFEAASLSDRMAQLEDQMMAKLPRVATA